MMEASPPRRWSRFMTASLSRRDEVKDECQRCIFILNPPSCHGRVVDMHFPSCPPGGATRRSVAAGRSSTWATSHQERPPGWCSRWSSWSFLKVRIWYHADRLQFYIDFFGASFISPPFFKPNLWVVKGPYFLDFPPCLIVRRRPLDQEHYLWDWTRWTVHCWNHTDCVFLFSPCGTPPFSFLLQNDIFLLCCKRRCRFFSLWKFKQQWNV